MSTKRLIPNDSGLSITTTAVFIAGEMAGSGILTLPKAVEDIGWAGLILLVLCAIISAYTGALLGEAWIIATDLFDDCKGHVQNPYQLLGQKSIGKAGSYFISICLHFSIFGGVTVLLLLSANNMQNLVASLGHDISFCIWLLIIAGFLTPLTWFGTPKHFWMVAYGATVATASAGVLVVVCSILDASKQPPVHHQEPDVQKIVLAMGTIMFAYGGHPIFLTIQMDMKNHQGFKKAISFGIVTTTIINLTVASTGYIVYGKNLNANVLSNLPSDGLSYTALLLITIHLLLAFIILLNPILQEIDRVFHLPKEFTWKRCVVRFLVVITIVFVAETIPKFDVLLSLIGGSTMTILSFVCPTIFHMKMIKMKENADEEAAKNLNVKVIQVPRDQQTTSLPRWKMVLNYAIMCIGALAGLAASVSAIINIVSPDSFVMPCFVTVT